MADEDKGTDDEVWPDAFRRFLRRTDPPGSAEWRRTPALGPGPVDVEPEARPREPDVDVIEAPSEVYVTVEVPGISREDVELRVTGSTLVVSASSPSRRFHREISLPVPVIEEPFRATCTNGVLDVTLTRKPVGPRVAAG